MNTHSAYVKVNGEKIFVKENDYVVCKHNGDIEVIEAKEFKRKYVDGERHFIVLNE